MQLFHENLILLFGASRCCQAHTHARTHSHTYILLFHTCDDELEERARRHSSLTLWDRGRGQSTRAGLQLGDASGLRQLSESAPPDCLLRKRGLVYLRPAALFPLLHFDVLQPSELAAAPSEAIDPSVVVNVPTGLQLSPRYGFLLLRFNCLLVFVFVLTQRVRNGLLLMCSDAEEARSCVSVCVWQLRAGKAPLLLEVLTEW